MWWGGNPNSWSPWDPQTSEYHYGWVDEQMAGQDHSARMNDLSREQEWLAAQQQAQFMPGILGSQLSAQKSMAGMNANEAAKMAQGAYNNWLRPGQFGVQDISWGGDGQTTGRIFKSGDNSLRFEGGMGLGAGGGWGPSQFQGPSGFENNPVAIPDAWEQMMIDPGSITDTKAVIESYRPIIDARRDDAFADAGAQFGQTGFAASSPYMEALGREARRAATEEANIANQYLYNAAEAQANRDIQAQMQNAANNLGAWQTHGGWQMQGGLQDDMQDFGAWQQQGDWANDQWMAKNNWDLQKWATNNSLQAQMMANLMGSFL